MLIEGSTDVGQGYQVFKGETKNQLFDFNDAGGYWESSPAETIYQIRIVETAYSVFEYMSMRKDRDRFEFLPIAEYTVDLGAGTVAERVLDATVSARSASPVSPVHEGARPGSYAPARNT